MHEQAVRPGERDLQPAHGRRHQGGERSHGATAIENILSVFDGRPNAANVVNKEVLG